MEVKPCYICGGDPVIHSNGGLIKIMCCKQGVAMTTEEGAIQVWNRAQRKNDGNRVNQAAK